MDIELPPTEPIPTIDPEAATQFLIRLRANTRNSGRAVESLRDDR